MAIDLGLATIGGGLISAAGNIFGANKSAESSEKNTAAQITWERERAQNAHQWEVEDLKKAGINPILSAGGSGAITGSISPQMPDYSGYGRAGENITNALISASQINTESQKLENEYEKILSDIGLNDQLKKESLAKEIEHLANAKLKDQDTLTSASLELKNKHEAAYTEEQTKQLKIMRGKLNEELKQARTNTLILYEKIKNAPNEREKIKAEAEFKKAQADLYKASKIVAMIGTAGMGFGAVMKAGRIWQLGKKAYQILQSIPKN